MTVLYVHESGDPTGPPIVFLHGGGLSGRMWQPQMDALAEFHCLAPDLYRQINRATGEVRLPQKPVPGTLIVVGQREPAMSRRHAARIGGTVPGVVACVVQDVGHAWNLQAPDLFNATVRAWLAGDPLPAALTPLQPSEG